MMKHYVGTNLVKACPMTRGEYNALRGWEVPGDEDPADAGYLVEYVDGGRGNHPEFKGYTGWIPADVFERTYKEPPRMMNFGHALVMLKRGEKVARAGWNGKGMFLFLVPGSTFKVSRPPLLGIYPEGAEVEYHPHIDMKTAQGYVVPWLASQADVLAEDWLIVADNAG